MQCDYINECGSCTLSIPYKEQVNLKENLIRNKFKEFFDGDFEFFISKDRHYRTRAEFGIWHEKDEISYTMNSKNGNKICISSCPKVSEKIYNTMPILLSNLKKSEMLKNKLFAVEFTDSTNELLITLLYHKKLENIQSELLNLKENLKIPNLCIMARSRGEIAQTQSPNLIDSLNIDDEIYKLSYQETAFIQPNREVNQKMISWAKTCIKDSKDMLELYCGHGNFTIPLSFKFKKVLATEISKSSIKHALNNCDINSITNTKFIRLSADELMSAFAKVREFQRLKDIDIFSYNFSHILVDPPRAGLESSVINFIKNYENIIYISCNPKTLKENLKELCKTHKIAKFGIFDQFANTDHIECGVFLRSKNAR